MKFERIENKTIKETVLYGVHESGLKVYIIPKLGFCKYYAIYGTEYGSINDTLKPLGSDEKIKLPDGIAHFLEHKLFEQKDGSNAFDSFAVTGASSNAFTSFDMTAYLFSCSDNFYENLDILLEFVNHPYFTDENVAKEQGIIGQEIKMYDDDPNWRLFFNMLQAMYHNNPVKTDIAGTVESISHITPELLYKCCETYYNPSNMLLVMVGDIDAEKAVSYIDKHVSCKTKSGKVERERVGEPYAVAKQYVSQKLNVSKPMFMIGFKEKETEICGRALLEKQVVTQILMRVLFGSSSEFYMKLYEQGLIDGTFGTDVELEKSYGFSSLSGESNNPKRVFELVLEHIKEVKKTGIDQETFERAKRVMIGKNLKDYNSVEKIGNDFIRAFMDGFNPLDCNEVVEKVTMEALTMRLNEHFVEDGVVLSVVEPLEEN